MGSRYEGIICYISCYFPSFTYFQYQTEFHFDGVSNRELPGITIYTIIIIEIFMKML